MEGCSGLLRVPLHPDSRTFHRVGASLYLSPESKTLCQRWNCLNQIVTELGFSDIGSNADLPDVGFEDFYDAPKMRQDLLNSISDIHCRQARLTRPFGVVEEVACNPSTVGRGRWSLLYETSLTSHKPSLGRHSAVPSN
ncbi:unnamed protein product [Sphenostylis stenocarpa]|uniref:Uncharacterized protein n=1 Tax=Sphenostylis stenocarpa TaxID=92480 RepID=A0AA86S3V6_9FABA|nr:unnamed protein product [Sphenostylis stenocarpa]